MVVIRSNEFITTYYCNLLQFITITSTFAAPGLPARRVDLVVWQDAYYILLQNTTITTWLLLVTTKISLLPIVHLGT
jgi:hypothetical protein